MVGNAHHGLLHATVSVKRQDGFPHSTIPHGFAVPIVMERAVSVS